MTVQLRINNDIISTTLEIPEVAMIRPHDNKIKLSLRKSIHSLLNDYDKKTVFLSPKDDLEIMNHGFTIMINRALIERVSL